MLAATAVVVPPPVVRQAPASLVAVETARAVGHSPGVVWVLLLGSDARPGEPLLRSRADAIQLVGLNTDTGAATAIGIPRDSYVTIPGHGQDKINAALTYGGPQAMADAVASLVGIAPDYVLTAGFRGFRHLVNGIGGISVNSRLAFFDSSLMAGGFEQGRNELTGPEALIFARIRKSLPNGDFDRSRNQQRALLGILARVRSQADRAGFLERRVLSVLKEMDTNASPAELYRLAQAATSVEPSRFRSCVVSGSYGYAGAASVVFPDVAEARSIARRTRNDATLEGSCA
jgi:LCP family protein required for cell wall assembly